MNGSAARRKATKKKLHQEEQTSSVGVVAGVIENTSLHLCLGM